MIAADRRTYRVGDTFRLRISAINTSDRQVLLKVGWREQLAFYHLHPQTREQVEWPGRVCNAAWLDSAEVVQLGPGQSHVETRGIRVFTPDDVCTFDFRLKLGGIKDFARRFDTWQGFAWSNPLRVTVVDRP